MQRGTLKNHLLILSKLLLFALLPALNIHSQETVSKGQQLLEEGLVLTAALSKVGNTTFGEIDETLAKLPRALLAAQRLKRFQDKIILLEHGANLFVKKGETTEAEKLWRSAIELNETRKPGQKAAEVYLKYAEFLRISGFPSRAIETLENASKIYRKIRQVDLELETKQKIALIHAEEGNKDQAIHYADAAISSAVAINDLTKIGIAYRVKSEAELILAKCFQQDFEHKIVDNIQLLYQEEATLDDEAISLGNAALESLESAIDSFTRVGDNGEKANSLRLKGDFMLHCHKLEDAGKYFQEAYKLYSSSGTNDGFLDLLISMAVRDAMSQRIDTSLRTIDTAIGTTASTTTHPWLYLLKAEVLLKDFNDPEAKTTLQKGLQIAEANQDLDQLIALNQLLSLVEINLGNFREGFAALDSATQFQVQQVENEKQQIEKAREYELAHLEKTVKQQIGARATQLEAQLYSYEMYVRNAWIIGITFLACFIGLWIIRSYKLKETKQQLEQKEKELQKAKTAIKNAEEDRNTFFKGIAQELRTPMNGIVGAVPMLSDGELSPFQSNCANIIDISSRSITTLINDISDLSQLESGKLKLAKCNFSLTHLVESVVQLFEADTDNTDIEIICDVPSDPIPLLRGDPNRIQQILMALIARSLQSTYEGKVLVKLEKRIQNNEHIESYHLKIEDSGDAPDVAQLENFFEINPTTGGIHAVSQPPSMVGMSITKKLVDAMNGSISVGASRLGGTKIELILPFDISNAIERESSPQPFERFPRKRALLIDASEASHQTLSKHLRAWALNFETVEDVSSAAQLLDGPHGFDVIFLDCVQQDPELNLLERIAALRSHAIAEETPIILLSRFSNSDNSLELKRQNYIHQISKPFLVEQLHASLRQALHFKTPVSKSFAKLTPEIETEEGDDTYKQETMKLETAGFHFMPYILPTRKGIPVNPELKIVLAEDNIVNQKVTTLMLKKMGFEVTVVANGRQAVELVKNEDYDVVLMDKIMPVMDGLEACREIRKLENIKQPIIIALTASATMEDEIACRKANMDNFLAKPVKLEKMKAALGFATRLLEEREAEDLNVPQ